MQKLVSRHTQLSTHIEQAVLYFGQHIAAVLIYFFTADLANQAIQFIYTAYSGNSS